LPGTSATTPFNLQFTPAVDDTDLVLYNSISYYFNDGTGSNNSDVGVINFVVLPINQPPNLTPYYSIAPSSSEMHLNVSTLVPDAIATNTNALPLFVALGSVNSLQDPTGSITVIDPDLDGAMVQLTFSCTYGVLTLDTTGCTVITSSDQQVVIRAPLSYANNALSSVTYTAPTSTTTTDGSPTIDTIVIQSNDLGSTGGCYIDGVYTNPCSRIDTLTIPVNFSSTAGAFVIIGAFCILGVGGVSAWRVHQTRMEIRRRALTPEDVQQVVLDLMPDMSFEASAERPFSVTRPMSVTKVEIVVEGGDGVEMGQQARSAEVLASGSHKLSSSTTSRKSASFQSSKLSTNSTGRTSTSFHDPRVSTSFHDQDDGGSTSPDHHHSLSPRDMLTRSPRTGHRVLNRSRSNVATDSP
jgi:hypothetical protein